MNGWAGVDPIEGLLSPEIPLLQTTQSDLTEQGGAVHWEIVLEDFVIEKSNDRNGWEHVATIQDSEGPLVVLLDTGMLPQLDSLATSEHY